MGAWLETPARAITRVRLDVPNAHEQGPDAPESSQLLSAVENVYLVFRRYPLKSRIEGCPCCVRDEDQARIHSQSLRALTADDLDEFAREAMTTWGDDEDFRHFLPRLLELATGDPYDPLDAEILLSKLAYAAWREWPSQEQTAVESLLWLRWTTGLERDPKDFDADAWLCGVALAGVETSDYVEAWRTSSAPTAFAHIVEFMGSNPDLLANGQMGNAFYDCGPGDALADTMREWLSASLADPDFQTQLATWYQEAS